MTNKQLEMVEQELNLYLDNIKRLKKDIEYNKSIKNDVYSSSIFGELKHRGITLKNRITLFNKVSTRDLYE